MQDEIKNSLQNQQNSNITNPIIENKGKLRSLYKRVLFLLLIIVFFLAFLIFFNQNKNQNKPINPDQNLTGIFLNSVKENKVAIEQFKNKAFESQQFKDKGIIKMPTILNSSYIKAKDLPSNLLFIVPKDSVNLTLEKVTFENKKLGYRIVCDLIINQDQFFKNFNLPNNLWQLKSAVSKNDVLGLIFFDSKSYSVELDTIPFQTTNTHLEILIQQK